MCQVCGDNNHLFLAFTHNSTLAKNEPSWGSVDKTKLPHIAFAGKGEADKKSTWSYPHHWVQNPGKPDANGVYTSGTLFLHRGGLKAAWSAANGARSGQDATPAIKAHLRRHMAAIGMGKQEAAEAAEMTVEALDKQDADLISAGLLTAADLRVIPADFLSGLIER